MEIIDRTNFFEDTVANFVDAKLPDTAPDYISYRRKVLFLGAIRKLGWKIATKNGKEVLVSPNNKVQGEILETINHNVTDEPGYLFETPEISSAYWYDDNGVFRLSDHWGTCRTCEWHLNREIINDGKVRVGYSTWTNFYKIN